MKNDAVWFIIADIDIEKVTEVRNKIPAWSHECDYDAL